MSFKGVITKPPLGDPATFHGKGNVILRFFLYIRGVLIFATMMIMFKIYGWKTGKKPVEISPTTSDNTFVADTIGTFSCWSPSLMSRPCSIQVGGNAPDFRAVSIDNDTEVSFLSFIKSQPPNRPTVVNFGSITCPPWRAHIPKFDALHKKYASKANFITVYVAEAHSADQWHLTVNAQDGVCFIQPKTMQERIDIAKYINSAFHVGCPMLVDSMANESLTKYSSWPGRLCVIQDEKVLYYSGPGPFYYDIKELDQFLAKL